MPKQLKAKDMIGKPFDRNAGDYEGNLFIRALDKDVKTDVEVRFIFLGKKVKAYCPVVDSFLQFPKNIRAPGGKCICDIISTEGDGISGFWRYIKGSVRREGSNIVIG